MLLALVVCTWSGWACAEDPGQSPPEERWYDQSHRAVSHRIVRTGEWFDAFFGDERVEEDIRGTRLRLRTSVKLSEGGQLSPRAGFNLKLALPHLEDRFHIVIDSVRRDDDEVLDNDRIEGSFGDLQDEFDVSAAARVVLRDRTPITFDFDVGLKLRTGGADPFIKFRTKKIFDNDTLTIRATQFLFWVSGEGFGETTRLDFDTTLPHDKFFRSATDATWSEVSNGVEFEQRFSLYKHLLPSQRAVGLVLGADFQTDPCEVNRYLAQLRFRQRIHRDWLYFEIVPEAIFPDDRDFNFTPQITFRLDMIYGDY